MKSYHNNEQDLRGLGVCSAEDRIAADDCQLGCCFLSWGFKYSQIAEEKQGRDRKTDSDEDKIQDCVSYKPKPLHLSLVPVVGPKKYSLVIGDHEIRATGIHIRFAYPYRAIHSSRLADSLPNHFNVPQRAIGMTPVVL